MRRKQTEFEAWANEVTAQFKYVPSMKGKHVKRNLAIMRFIATEKKPLSAWDLAFEYLRLTQPQLWQTPPEYRDATIYHERQKENSQMQRRLKFLLNKKYVKKLGSVYRLTAKGVFLLFVLDPSVAVDFTDSSVLEDLGDTLKYRQLVDDTAGKYSLEQRQVFLGTLKDKDMAAGFSFMLKRKLFAWKINLDEIDSKELFNVLFSHLNQK
jgi:hypothetical protein